MADKDFNEVKEDVEEKVDETVKDVKEEIAGFKTDFKVKLAELEATYNEKRKVAVAEFKEKMIPVGTFLDKVKMNFGQVCDYLDTTVFGNVRKAYIAIGGVVLALLVWIF